MTTSDLSNELAAMSTRQIVRWLTTPAKSGFFLSPSDIERLGATIGFRVTPYGRANGLEQFLRGAALDDQLAAALVLLQVEMAAQIARYRQLELPELESWVARAENTLQAWATLSDSGPWDVPE
jgi:hypothetical protein